MEVQVPVLVQLALGVLLLERRGGGGGGGCWRREHMNSALLWEVTALTR